MTKAEALQHPLDAVQKAKPPTHTIYTPKWEPDWAELESEGQIVAGQFYGWLSVGRAWQDDSGVTFQILSQPTNHEETATSYFKLVAVGAPPPAPLTITRDEYLEQQFTAYHG